MKNDFLIAITQLCAEKNLPREVIFEAIDAALVSAYKRNFGSNQNITVKIVPTTGEVKVFAQKTVVEEVTDKRLEYSLDEARRIKPDAELGDLLEEETTPHDFGRIAAQTAKQVVLQRLREAEREVVFEEFVDKEGDIISGVIQRIEPKQIIIDLGKTEAILPISEQVQGEHYRIGQRIKVFLLEVHKTNKGPQVIVSRTHRNLLRRLFELEVPEIFNGAVELKSIAREAGSRSKVAVAARQEGIDPVGSCVGLRGIRIQNIVNELGGEKIDVVQWSQDSSVYVANALSPAQVVDVEVNDNDKTASVVVPDRQLSLAIGKEGQNARLAAKLTGWRIDIKSASVSKVERAEKAAQLAAEEEAKAAAALLEEPVVAEEPLVAVEANETAILSETEQPVGSEYTEQPVAEVMEAATESGLPIMEETRVEEEVPLPEEEELERIPLDLVMPTGIAPTEEKPRIRFAEDLLGDGRSRAKERDTKDRDKKGKGKKAEEETREVEGAKAKKPRKSRVVYEIEDEEEAPVEDLTYEESTEESTDYDYLKGQRK